MIRCVSRSKYAVELEPSSAGRNTAAISSASVSTLSVITRKLLIGNGARMRSSRSMTALTYIESIQARSSSGVQTAGSSSLRSLSLQR